MKSVNPAAVRDVLLLSLAAGGADAICFLGFRVFTCNMTGNIVLLGLHVGQGDAVQAWRSLYVVAIFILGVALGISLTRDPAKQDWPSLARRLITIEKLALIFFGVGWMLFPDRSAHVVALPLLALLAVSMGLQSAAMNRLNAPGVGTTALTGTIIALINGLGQWWDRRAGSPFVKDSPNARIGFQTGVVALYCLGAIICGFIMLHIPWLAGCWPAALVLLTSWGRHGSHGDSENTEGR